MKAREMSMGEKQAIVKLRKDGAIEVNWHWAQV